MNRNFQITVLLVGVFLSLLTACSKRDKVINVESDDPEMTAAIAKPRLRPFNNPLAAGQK